MTQAEQQFRAELVSLLPRLRRFGRAITGHRQDADDLVQMALERCSCRAQGDGAPERRSAHRGRPGAGRGTAVQGSRCRTGHSDRHPHQPPRARARAIAAAARRFRPGEGYGDAVMTFTDDVLMAYVDREPDAQTRAAIDAAAPQDPGPAARLE